MLQVPRVFYNNYYFMKLFVFLEKKELMMCIFWPIIILFFTNFGIGADVNDFSSISFVRALKYYDFSR